MLQLITLFMLISDSYQFNVSPYHTECNEKLLENKQMIPDSSFTQSSYEENFSGKYARESSDDEQAWCPKNKLGSSPSEFVEINLGQLSVIKMIMTRGRNAVGYTSAESYFIKYKLEENIPWKFYRNYSGYKELKGRSDPLNEKFRLLDPPIIARFIQIYPLQPSDHKICLKLQLYGCKDTNHVVEYRIVEGSYFNFGGHMSTRKFKDITYNGVVLPNGTLQSGTGKLTDWDIELTSTKSPLAADARKFIGWDVDQLKREFVEILFRFDSPRNFSKLFIRVSNLNQMDIRMFNKVEIRSAFPELFGEQIFTKIETIESDNRIKTNRWLRIDIAGIIGQVVRVRLYFAGRWIILSEIQFQSSKLIYSKEILAQLKKSKDKSEVTVKSTKSSMKPQNSNWPKSALPSNEKSPPMKIKSHSISLAQILGIICGSLALIILIGFSVLLYLHNRKNRSWPIKSQYISQLKYNNHDNHNNSHNHPQNNSKNITNNNNGNIINGFNINQQHHHLANHSSLFNDNDSDYYSAAKLSKGTFIPFNISPYKYQLPVTSATGSSIHQSPTKLPSYDSPSFLTPNHHHSQLHNQTTLIYPHKYSSQLVVSHNNTNNNNNNNINQSVSIPPSQQVAIDNNNCIYTSLPASDTESLDSPSPQLFFQTHTNKNNNYWTTSRSVALDKIFCNPSALHNTYDHDNSPVTFQCYPDYSQTGTMNNNLGMLFTNKQLSQDYDSFHTSTWNESEDDSEGVPVNSLWNNNYTYHELHGCCGNSTMFHQTSTVPSKHELEQHLKPLMTQPFDDSQPLLTKEYLEGLVTLGTGVYGKIAIDSRNHQQNAKNEPRAYKILNDSVTSDIKSRFLQELYRQSLVNHERVARVISINLITSSALSQLHSDHNNITTGSIAYIICEYSPYGDLYSFINQKKCFLSHSKDVNAESLSVSSISHVLLQVGQAIQYLSLNQIVHRDISARNLLVTAINFEQDSVLKLTIKLSDYALSQAQYQTCYVRPSKLVSTLPVSSSLLPLQWASPEIIIANQYSSKSDIYSLGIMGWELLNHCQNLLPLTDVSNEQLIVQLVSLYRQSINQSPLSSAQHAYNHMTTAQHKSVLSQYKHQLLTIQYPHQHQLYKSLIELLIHCTHIISSGRPYANQICTKLQSIICTQTSTN